LSLDSGGKIMHAREQIRLAFIAALETSPALNIDIFNGRIWPVHNEILPCMVVSTREELVEDDEHEKGTYLRKLAVKIETYLKQENDIDSTADDLAVEVEKAVAADNFLRGICHNLESTVTETSSGGENEIAVCTIVYGVLYNTKIGDPENIA